MIILLKKGWPYQDDLMASRPRGRIQVTLKGVTRFSLTCCGFQPYLFGFPWGHIGEVLGGIWGSCGISWEVLMLFARAFLGSRARLGDLTASWVDFDSK